MMKTTRDWFIQQYFKSQQLAGEYLRRGLRICASEKGQGTTEYAILVGVLVVIAIIAVVAFRDNLQKLWEAISDGINGL